ncbi:MAG: ATPase, T2SS/T4P/T4SS family, partial [Erysipelotrichaceae bacterium]|nr:ATPase, T2SS/T4P/T4SS family [Erysipelotrichaceae bacterium]
MKNLPIGEFLKDAGYITEDHIKMALDAQKNDRTKRLGEHLIDLGFVSEKQMLMALSKKLGDTMVELDRIKVDINAVKKIPKTMAEKYVMIAYRQENNVLTVVTNDPLNYYGIEDVRLVTGMNINIEIATKKEIEKAINNYYQEVVAFDIADDIQGINPDVSPLELGALADDDTPVVKLLNSLLNRGYNNGVSDIHIEPTKENLRIRMRIDGLLVDYINLNINILNSLVVRVKILANLNIAEKRVPQDGHFIIDIDGNDINMRVSTIPTVHGEKIVMRYLNNNAPITYADSFGMNDFNFEKMKSILKMPHGIIFVT